MITAYFLNHGHWTVIPHQLDDNFADMVDCGFKAVAISVSESEMKYSRRALEIQINLAKKRKLKVFAIPSRIGGRFAGAPLMPSLWLATHPHCAVPNRGSRLPIACLESPEFVDWVKEFLSVLIGDYDLDGLIWDEPKEPGFISLHPESIIRYGSSPTEEQMCQGFVNFLQEMTAYCLDLFPRLIVSLFVQISDPEYFTERAAKIKGIRYFGYDGNLAPQSYFHEEPDWHKYRIEEAWERTLRECSAGNKKTFALIENTLMPASAIPEYEANLEAYLQNYRPNQLAFYYYALNNEDPETVQEITRRMMKKYL
ncbi:MAG TPA: hypothetical protein VIO61_14255 [Anaerolineaceae bacterium]